MASIGRRPRPAETHGWAPPIGLVVICVAVVALVALPVVLTVVNAVTAPADAVASSLAGLDVTGSILRTLLLAAMVTPACALIGVAAAWLVERTTLPLRRVWALLLVAPIAIPPFVTSWAWAGMGTFWQGLVGAAVITACTYYPIVYLLTAASLRGLDPALEDSARSLGCGPWRTFFRVILPQLRPALLGGLLLVGLDTLVEFEAFVGIHPSVFVSDVYFLSRVEFSTSGAAALSCFSIVLCVAVLVAERLARGGAGYARLSRGARRPPVRRRLGRWTVASLLFVGIVVAAGVGIPVAELGSWWSQATPDAVAAAPAPPSGLPAAAVTSLWVGAGAALVTLLLALPLAILATRYRGVVVDLLERGSFLAFALPDLVAAVALGVLASSVLTAVYVSVPLLLVADAILFLPFAVVALRASLGQVEPQLEEVSRSLGLGPLRTLWRVTLPVLRPGLAAAGVLVFAFVLGDISTTRELAPPGLTTLGTQFEIDAAGESFGAAAPYALCLMLTAVLVTYVLMSRFGRARLREVA